MAEALIELALDDGALDVLVSYPDTPGRKSPILLLSRGEALASTAASTAHRLSAHNYFVLAPDLAGLAADERQEAAWACLDHFACESRVDDTRVGAVGFGVGADVAVRLAAERSERIVAVAAYGGRGFNAQDALEISQKINGLVRLGYALGDISARSGLLETALNLSGVLFDTEIYQDEPGWADLLDFFARGLGATSAEPEAETARAHQRLNP